MAEYLSFVLFWIILMALIGIALWLTPRFRPKDTKPEENLKENDAQDIAGE